MPLKIFALVVAMVPTLAYAHPGVHELIGVRHAAVDTPAMLFDAVLIMFVLAAFAGWRIASSRPLVARSCAVVGLTAGAALLFA